MQDTVEPSLHFAEALQVFQEGMDVPPDKGSAEARAVVKVVPSMAATSNESFFFMDVPSANLLVRAFGDFAN